MTAWTCKPQPALRTSTPCLKVSPAEGIAYEMSTEHHWRTAAFEHWFARSVFREPDGTPTVFFHGSPAAISAFDTAHSVEGAGIHLGTLSQALMRTVRSRGHIHPVFVSAQKVVRRRDKGSWDKAYLAKAARSGVDAIIYLNRYEGMTSERIEDLHERGLLGRLDALPDPQFRRLVPEAQDSIIVLSPDAIKSVFNPGHFRSGPNLTDDPGIAAHIAANTVDPSDPPDWLGIHEPSPAVVFSL